MLNKKQKLLVKLFNNPLGRRYLEVPKGKNIYKITQNSVHYYTGEIAKNGMPIICTGNCCPNGRLKFIHFLETWKPIHLCWLFRKLKLNIPKYFIGDDTGSKSPSANGGKYSQWQNAANAYSSNNSYATTSGSNLRQSYETFAFGIPAGATINGIEVLAECKKSSGDFGGYLNVWNNNTSSWATQKNLNWTTTETIHTVGSSTDLWGKSWVVADFSDANFSVYIADIADGYTYYLDHIQVKVYYTLPVDPPTVTTQAATAVAQTTCTGNGNITDTGGANATRRGFCYMAGTSGDPTTANSVAYDDGDFGTGAFTKGITGLSAGTGYRVRAYAVNSAGTGYGATVQVTTKQAYYKTCEEVVAINDTLTKTPGKVLSEALSIIDSISIQKTLKRTLSETITIVDNVDAKKIATKTLSEVISIVDTIKMNISKIFSETISIVDNLSIQKVLKRTLSETISIVDSIEKSIIKFKTLVENISIVDSITKKTSRVFTETVTIVGTLSKQLIKIKIFSEAITITDSISKSISRIFTETISIIPSFAAQTYKVARATIKYTGQVLSKLKNTENIKAKIKKIINN